MNGAGLKDPLEMNEANGLTFHQLRPDAKNSRKDPAWEGTDS